MRLQALSECIQVSHNSLRLFSASLSQIPVWVWTRVQCADCSDRHTCTESPGVLAVTQYALKIIFFFNLLCVPVSTDRNTGNIWKGNVWDNYKIKTFLPTKLPIFLKHTFIIDFYSSPFGLTLEIETLVEKFPPLYYRVLIKYKSKHPYKKWEAIKTESRTSLPFNKLNFLIDYFKIPRI